MFILAGELSGDMNAALLAREVLKREPGFEFVGYGGPKMKEAGVRILADSTTWGSIGMFEGVFKAPVVYPWARRLPGFFRDEKPDLFVPVDYRFFNMKAAAVAKKQDIPVVYFFAPVSWFGTGEKRFEMMKGLVDLALVALPLSLDSYAKAGIKYEYIGHPLVDAAKPSMTKEAALDFFGLKGDAPIVGLMPGSRTQEISRLTPVFAASVKLIAQKIPDAQFILFRASDKLEPLIKKHLKDAPVRIVREKVYDFMNVCDSLILCSGTATHEACLMKTPMVITYKFSTITAWLARRMMKPQMMGLPNILSGEMIVPELFQELCTPEAVAEKTIEILSDASAKDRISGLLAGVNEKLGKPGVVERAADSVIKAAKGSF